MSNENRRSLSERVGNWRFILALLASAGIYFYFIDSSVRFREQIQLSSGEVILVDRLFKTESFGEIGGPGGWDAKFNSIEVIESNELDTPPIWTSDAGLIPILFDRDRNTKEWYLVTTFYSCQAWYQLGRPSLPYAEFRLRNNIWQSVPLTPSLIGRSANVLTTIRNKEELALHTLATKRERMSDARIVKKYSEIVSSWATGC